MPWIYTQSTGVMSGPNGEHYQGYSGNGMYRNNPDAEDRRNEGPIPQGQWNINLTPYHGNGGPNSLALTPVNHNAHGRTDFVIHGDNIQGNASTGCIILPLNARQAIMRSGDNILIIER